MLDGKRGDTPLLLLTLALYFLSGAAAAAEPSVADPTGADPFEDSISETGRRSVSAAIRPIDRLPNLRVVSGYLDRGASAVCDGGTHQLRDSCSDIAVPLQSASLDLDAYLCRYLEAVGEQAGSGNGVLEAFGLRETLNLCPADCDADGLHDQCAIRHRLIPDCNGNDRPDRCDIQSGASLDCNRDAVPDECQVAACELDDGIIRMSISSPDRISWHPERGYSSFNVYRGSLNWLGATGAPDSPDGDGEAGTADEDAAEVPDPITGHGCNLKTVTIRDRLTPASGEAIYYLVTGNSHGAEHPQSLDSKGSRRVNSIPCSASADPLNVSVRTDKAVYAPGETVRIEVFLANLNPTGEIDLLFATRCRVSFRIEDLNGESLYLELSHRSCSYDENRLTLKPGQIASYDFVWDQKDDRGRPVEHIAGYVVRGMLLHHDPAPDGITGISIRP